MRRHHASQIMRQLIRPLVAFAVLALCTVVALELSWVLTGPVVPTTVVLVGTSLGGHGDAEPAQKVLATSFSSASGGSGAMPKDSLTDTGVLCAGTTSGLYAGYLDHANLGDELLGDLFTQLLGRELREQLCRSLDISLGAMNVSCRKCQLDVQYSRYMGDRHCVSYANDTAYNWAALGGGSLFDSYDYARVLQWIRPLLKEDRLLVFGAGFQDSPPFLPEQLDFLLRGNVSSALDARRTSLHPVFKFFNNFKHGGVRGPVTRMIGTYFLQYPPASVASEDGSGVSTAEPRRWPYWPASRWMTKNSGDTFHLPVLYDSAMVTLDVYQPLSKAEIFRQLGISEPMANLPVVVFNYENLVFGTYRGQVDLRAVFTQIALALAPEHLVVFQPLHRHYMSQVQDMVADLRKKLHAKNPSAAQHVLLYDLPDMYTYPEVIGLLKLARFSVNVKQHATILSAAVGTPFIAVAYLVKIFDFAYSMGMEEMAFSLTNFTAAAVMEVVGREYHDPVRYAYWRSVLQTKREEASSNYAKAMSGFVTGFVNDAISEIHSRRDELLIRRYPNGQPTLLITSRTCTRQNLMHVEATVCWPRRRRN